MPLVNAASRRRVRIPRPEPREGRPQPSALPAGACSFRIETALALAAHSAATALAFSALVLGAQSPPPSGSQANGS